MPNARGAGWPSEWDRTAVAPAIAELFPPLRGVASQAFCRAGNIFIFLLESLLCPISNPAPGTGFQPL